MHERSSLFSGENEKNIVNLSSAEFALRVLNFLRKEKQKLCAFKSVVFNVVFVILTDWNFHCCICYSNSLENNAFKTFLTNCLTGERFARNVMFFFLSGRYILVKEIFQNVVY